VIKALIIDDEESAVIVIKMLLQQHAKGLDEIHTAIGSQAGLIAMKKIQPQLVFLDIEMPMMGGFELLEKFPDHSFEVIFVTAFDHYAIKAIRYSALDYLLKPVDQRELQEAVARFFEKKASGKGNRELYQNLLRNLRTEDEKLYKLAISNSEGIFLFYPKEIVRLEALGNYTRFHFTDRKPLITSKTLKEYDELLSDHEFIRVHRAHLVNRQFISSIAGDHELHLSDQSVVEVSRRKWDQVKKAIGA
jgi:two-component system LytT family response regulator